MSAYGSVVIVGCGTIGLPLATAFARAGVCVTGFDMDATRIDALRTGAVPIERDLAEALGDALRTGDLTLCSRMPAPPPGPRAYVVAVPTPWAGGRFDDRLLDAAIGDVLAVGRDGDALCIRSTVPVGTAAAVSRRARAAGLALDIASTPDRSVEGRSFGEQFEVPHLVGADDAEATARVAALFAMLGPTTICSGAAEAEAAKLLCNVTRDAMFGLANEVARICAALGLDGRAVCEAAGRGYPRFGLPRAGPVGGPCLTKDTELLLASRGAPDSNLLRAARAANDSVVEQAADAIARHVSAVGHPRIAVLGVAFKGQPPVADLRGSAALAMVELLRRVRQLQVVAWDHEIDAVALAAAGLSPGATPLQTVAGAAAVVLGNDHPGLREIAMDDLLAAAHPRALIYDLGGQLAGMPVRLGPGQSLKVVGGGERARPAVPALA